MTSPAEPVNYAAGGGDLRGGLYLMFARVRTYNYFVSQYLMHIEHTYIYILNIQNDADKICLNCKRAAVNGTDCHLDKDETHKPF